MGIILKHKGKIKPKIKGKKGQAGIATYSYYIILSSFLILGVTFFSFFLFSGFKSDINYEPSGLEQQQITSRFLYSGECFAYYDEGTFEVRPLHIDTERMSDEVMDSCINSEDGYKVTLIYGDGSISAESASWTGASTFSYSKNVIVHDEEGEYNGVAVIEVEDKDGSV